MKKILFSLCFCLLPSLSAGQELFTADDVRIMHDAGVKVAFPGERTAQVLPADAPLNELLKVEMLDFSNSSLHRIPPWLKRFTNLLKLDLSKNQLDADSDLLETLQAMPKLDVLNLSGNPLFAGETAAQSLAPVWQRLNELGELYLSETQGAAKNYGSLAPLQSLKVLDLSNNQIANEVGALELNKLAGLEELNLSKNGMSTFPATELPAQGLKSLDLSFNELTEISYVEMNELRIWQLHKQENGPVRLAEDYGDLFALKELKKLQCDSPSQLPEGLKKRLERMAQDRLHEQRRSACAEFGLGSCDSGVMTDPVSGMQFMYIPGGCFDMGSDENDDEKPVHEVCVNAFWMGKYEVTQGQWRKVMGGNPAKFQKGDDYPVEQVSWKEAQEFITKLTSMTGKKFSLPAEAEWEYACRAGGSGRYCGGDDPDLVAWYDGNSGGNTHPVGGKEKNFFGLHDMSGNVWEWCSDWYGKDYYASSPKDNPTGPERGGYRVLRGGSFFYFSQGCRAVYRYGYSPGNRDGFLGLRLVLPLPGGRMLNR
ncbi:MAG: Formylglycine-generating enzyme, required for sulfatase activity, contains SUMF1/FGE domain [Candidatus Electronema aureum]|uniref:Formylglycine-generating enzyme, required for sulfatase activity, contains SUMF1/FGE domain n=1 Tax=Candidatus Electronema aureum TaxID=2005002 RepID=A0A521G5D9_9BACT|nr:MAG: Formylglycine-generating enzyme, required for sulfatase activity, contains SUMF1/FGE domain [Candidatus Electronema aureum]